MPTSLFEQLPETEMTASNSIDMKTFKLKKTLIPFLGVLASTGALAVDSYDPATRTLNLDVVTVGAETYRRVTVVVEGYDQLVVAGGAPGQTTFDPATSTLRMGNVNFESNTYTNVSLRILGYSLRGTGSDENGYLQYVVPTPTYPAGSDVLTAFNYLNDERVRCGFGKLIQNSALDRAAFSHAKYEDSQPVIGDTRSAYRENPGAAGFTGVTASDRAAAQGYQTTSPVFDAKGVTGILYYTNLTPGTAAGLENSAVGLMRKMFARRFEGLRLLSEGTEVGIGKVTRDFSTGNTRYVGSVLDVAIGNASYAQGQTPSTAAAIRTYPCEGTTNANPNSATTYFPVVGSGSAFSSSPIFVVGEPGKTLTIDDVAIFDVNSSTGETIPVLHKHTRANDPDGALLPNNWTGYIVASRGFGPRPFRVDIKFTSGGVAGTKTFTFTGGRN